MSGQVDFCRTRLNMAVWSIFYLGDHIRSHCNRCPGKSYLQHSLPLFQRMSADFEGTTDPQVQLIRIQLRVPEYGWTTQKMFHLLNFLVCLVRMSVFVLREPVSKLEPVALQAVLLDLPGALLGSSMPFSPLLFLLLC